MDKNSDQTTLVTLVGSHHMLHQPDYLLHLSFGANGDPNRGRHGVTYLDAPLLEQRFERLIQVCIGEAQE